jgi:hypothetical protein
MSYTLDAGRSSQKWYGILLPLAVNEGSKGRMTDDSMSQALGAQAYVYVAPIETYHEVAIG